MVGWQTTKERIIKKVYRNIPIKGATLIKEPPIVWESQKLPEMA